MGYRLTFDPQKARDVFPGLMGETPVTAGDCDYRLLLVEDVSVGELHELLAESGQDGWRLDQVLPVEDPDEPAGVAQPAKLGILLKRKRSE